MASLKETVNNLLVDLRDAGVSMGGPKCIRIGRLIHIAGLDTPCQWGNVYFRCPECGQANDCETEADLLDERGCRFCEYEVDANDLRISEGWIERLGYTVAIPASR